MDEDIKELYKTIFMIVIAPLMMIILSPYYIYQFLKNKYK
jgi:hypothetical protein